MINDMETTNFPYDIVPIDDFYEKASLLLHDLIDKDVVQVGPKKYKLPGVYKNCYKDIYKFKARPDDILLIGHPRTGTTLHCEMIWQIENGLDFETPKKVVLPQRFLMIDLALCIGDPSLVCLLADKPDVTDDVKDIAKGYNTMTFDYLVNHNEKRFIRSHLPISLLPPSFFEENCKVIYCARNPKDLVVSYYYIAQYFKPKQFGNVSFESFWKSFKNNWTQFSPYFEHVKEAWERRNDKNFLFIFYEESVQDLKGTIQKMATFLEKKLTDEQQNSLCDYLGIEKFKSNKSVNNEHLSQLGIVSTQTKFIRNGKPGGWKKYFIGDLEIEADEWIKENLKDTDLVFPEC